MNNKKGVRIKNGDEKMAKTKIFVVEDETITAKEMQKMLKYLGYDAPAIASAELIGLTFNIERR